MGIARATYRTTYRTTRPNYQPRYLALYQLIIVKATTPCCAILPLPTASDQQPPTAKSPTLDAQAQCSLIRLKPISWILPSVHEPLQHASHG